MEQEPNIGAIAVDAPYGAALVAMEELFAKERAAIIRGYEEGFALTGDEKTIKAIAQVTAHQTAELVKAITALNTEVASLRLTLAAARAV